MATSKLLAKTTAFMLASFFSLGVAAPAVERSSIATLPKPAAAGAPWTREEIGGLDDAIDTALHDCAALHGAHVGLYVVDTRTGTPLYMRGIDDDFTPASNMKLVTGSAALARLGRGFRFHTALLATAPPRGGVIAGDLVLRGGGDALLRASDLAAAAGVLAALGVRVVRGGILTDASYFEQKRYGAGWVVDDLAYAYAPPISALSLEDNVLNPETASEKPVSDPSAHAADVLRRALADRGIALERSSIPGQAAPGSVVLWKHDSEPLSELLADFWYPSDNLIGELLLDALGVAQGGAPGRAEAGVALEQEFLRSMGVDPQTVLLSDGSGLSRYDQLTPRALVSVLQYDWNSPNRDLVLDSLPVAGVRGTLQERFKNTPVAGRIFAKSGGMLNVTNLSGYVANRRHGAMTFSFLIDDALGEDAPIEATRTRIFSLLMEE